MGLGEIEATMNSKGNGEMDTTPLHSPAPEADNIKVSDVTLTNDTEGNNAENSEMDVDCSQESTSNSKLEDPLKSEKEVNPEPNIKNSNNTPADTPDSNSNDSCSESIDSSQGKPENVIPTNSKNNNEDSERDGGRTGSTNEEEEESDESDGESSDEDADGSEGPRGEEIVSITLESRNLSSQDSNSRHTTSEDSNFKHKAKSDKGELSGSQNGDNTSEPPSPEVHEILSDHDDCVITIDEKPEKSKPSTNQVEDKGKSLRRSSRAPKRKRYDDMEAGDEESDIEEVAMQDPLNECHEKSKTIVINDTKTLLRMAKQAKSSHGNSDKSEPTVVIIDTNSILSGKLPISHSKNSTTSINSLQKAQSLYQSIEARGTTVTPISSKSQNAVSVTPAQPTILPSLTDDMFVVEAPSFIVPYVYEKPSIKPFKDFVETLGEELEKEKAKKEQEKLAKEKELKKDKDDKKIDGEEETEEMDVDEKSDKDPKEDDAEEEKATKKKDDKKEHKKRRYEEEDDVSWDGESSEDSDDEIPNDEEKTEVIKQTDEDGDDFQIKDKIAASDITTTDKDGVKSDNYFSCSLGQFFINIGLNLVQEYVQTDLLKQQNRKLYKEKKQGAKTRATESAIASLSKNIEFSKQNNAPYRFPLKKCEHCSFKSESKLVLDHHLEIPHMKNNLYKCNHCPFEIRSSHGILYHVEAEHNKKARLERATAYHQCANCPFEDNGKGKLARHMIPCAKRFKPDLNLAPPVEWEPPAKIPKITRARNNNMMAGYQPALNKPLIGNNVGRPPLNMGNVLPGTGNNYRARTRTPSTASPRGAPVHGTPLVRGGVMARHNSPNSVLLPNNYPVMPNNQSTKNLGGSFKILQHQQSLSITPLPRTQQPAQPQSTQSSKATFVICEICDGYIKDLEQLRNHMQWIHKVKIHPKMIYNRPPLNCQKCQFRFFTDQGLERHLLGSHGLVTSSMQEAANKGKDAGRCPVCGRVYQWKLLNHVAKDHSLTLKPAHLSYKCTVCTATFGMYKQFENHVYSAHSVVTKRVMEAIAQ